MNIPRHPAAPRITGLVLAGGLGRRMGGEDKGLIMLDGRPLVAHVLARLAPQVGALLISANRNFERYRQLGGSSTGGQRSDAQIISDRMPDHAGPLAGIQAALAVATTPLLAVVPCDTPALPEDLVARLHAALEDEAGSGVDGVDVAVARSAGRTHPTCCLLRRTVRESLDEFLASGGRAVREWQAGLRTVDVDFADPTAFANLNSREELARADAGNVAPPLR